MSRLRSRCRPSSPVVPPRPVTPATTIPSPVATSSVADAPARAPATTRTAATAGAAGGGAVPERAIRPEGSGFLRCTGYLPGDKDVYVSATQVRKFGLRRGDSLPGPIRPPRSQEKFPALTRIDTVSGMTVEEARRRPRFGDLTPLFPDERLPLEVAGQPNHVLARIIDLIAPIGKGQRGLIVSPPKAGKTTVLKEIANSISSNNPECQLIVVLVDERPEEVTDMQ